MSRIDVVRLDMSITAHRYIKRTEGATDHLCNGDCAEEIAACYNAVQENSETTTPDREPLHIHPPEGKWVVGCAGCDWQQDKVMQYLADED